MTALDDSGHMFLRSRWEGCFLEECIGIKVHHVPGCENMLAGQEANWVVGLQVQLQSWEG